MKKESVNTQTSIDKVNHSFDSAGSAASDAADDVDGASDSMGDFGIEADKASEKTSSFADKLKSGLATAVKAGAAAIAAATTAVAAFAKSSIETGMTFDSSMSQVAATMGTTVDKITQLRDFAMEMGAKTAFSASQAADALNYMALAGYDADQAMQALPNVLNLAAAGGIELAAASDMVTDAQSALGLSMEESAELVDKMAMASSKSNTSVAQLGEAILTIGGTAKNLAGGTTELSTALGILADNGVKGAEGGTALRNIILSLSAPTDTAAEAMEDLGLKVYDAEGNMRPLNETFGDLEKVLSTMTQGEQTQVLNKIFNKVDLKSVNALLANTGERFDELSGYIDEASGATENMAATRLDNLAGDITLFQSALDNAQIVLSDQLTPALRGFVQFGSESISALSTAFQEGGLSGAMDALGTILRDGLSMVIGTLPDMIKAGTQLLGALGKGILDNKGTIINAALNIAEMLLNTLFNLIPQLPAIAGELIQALGSGLAEKASALIPAAVKCCMQFAQGLVNQLPTLLKTALQLVRGLADGILAAIPELIAALPDLINGIADFLIQGIPQLIETAVYIVEQLVASFPAIISALIDALPQIIEGIVSGLVGCIGQLVAGAIQLVVMLVTHLPEIMIGLVAAVPEIVQAIIQGFIDALPSFTDAGKTIMEALEQGIRDVWAYIQRYFSEIIPNLIDSIGTWFSELPGTVGRWLNAVLDWAANWSREMAARAQKAGSDFVNGAVNFIKNLPGNVWTWLQNVIEKVKTFAANFAGNAKKAGQEFFSNLVSRVQEIPGRMLSIGKNIVQGIWNGISGAAGWLWNKVTGFANNILGTVKRALGIASPSKAFAAIGGFMAEGLGKGWDDEYTGVKKDIESGLHFDAGSISGAEIPVSYSEDYTGYTAPSAWESKIADAVNANFEKMFAILSEYFPQFANQQLVLDTGVVAGQMAPAMDAELGRLSSMRRRGV